MIPGFHIDIRGGPREGRIEVGQGAVLGGGIVLERDQGHVRIGANSYIGSGTLLVCAESITIGDDVLIAWGCTIVDHDSHSLDWQQRAEDVRLWREGLQRGGPVAAASLKDWDVVSRAAVCIEDKCWLGFNVIVVKGVTIGEGAVVAAGSVVTRDVAPWTLVGGNPARLIRSLNDGSSPG